MQRLKNENCNITFETKNEMKKFLKEMEDMDEYVPIKLNSIRTWMENEEMKLEGENCETNEHINLPLWPFSMKSLEKRSGDDAKGHSLMTTEQILNSMNNYWGLYPDKKVCVARIRGEKIMGIGSEQYESISQMGLIETTEKWLEDRHKDMYDFTHGRYTHLLTSASFVVKDAITPSYKAAWKKAGLPNALLNSSKIVVDIFTDDTAECAAKAIVQMNVGGSMFLIGNPVLVEHRSGHGGLDAFERELDKMDLTIQDELDSLSNLMGITLDHPREAAISALKKAKIDKLTKKACKELVDDMMFATGESAYIVYLYLHGILDTSYGSGLSEERKLRVTTALRTLLKEDWKKMDVAYASL